VFKLALIGAGVVPAVGLRASQLQPLPSVTAKPSALLELLLVTEIGMALGTEPPI
jgi:hypothetical protein